MNMGTSPAVSHPIDMKGWQVTNTSKTIFTVLVIAGLVLMNVLTLLNDRFHSAAFGLLEGVLSSILTDAAFSRATSKSPTVKRRGDAALATKEMRDKHNKLLASRASLQKQHVLLTRNHQSLSTKHQLLTNRISTQNVTIATISHRLARRTMANAARNTASLAGEAVPIIGTALILGVTALDIKDACEAMKDSNALNNLAGNSKQYSTTYCGYTPPSKDDLLAQIRGNWKSAYASAASAINIAGSNLVPANPPKLSWGAAKGPLCATLGNNSTICQ